MVRVCVWCVVQNHGLGEIPPQEAEILDVVAEDADAVVLVQAVSARNRSKTFTLVSVNQVCL